MFLLGFVVGVSATVLALIFWLAKEG